MGSVELRTRYMQELSRSVGIDVKHSRNWRCEFCKKFARETVWSMASWLHLNPPRMNSYVHHLCNAGAGPCAEAFAEQNAEAARLAGHPPSWKPIGRPSPKYPMSATCAMCHEETESVRKSLKQCSRCKFTRYCGIKCQKEHYTAHKTFCKSVKDVKWVWN
ncbi:hypothetical protein AURDEDRAFT_111215 [Auricularia subglabra TFB-10046 SS5]|nr:hypothetical protein AURDEDRAFT_111215 [Auricularia subglabra TFB-10046 SS5]